MSKSLKLVLDILIGAAAPVAILKYGTAPLGTLPAYLVAAFVPVVWVLLDLFVITRRFNFITSYGGFSAVMRGALAFWYVDGPLFALKDSASYALAVLVFGISAFLAHPVTRSIAMQGLAPESPEEEGALDALMHEPTVLRALRQSALLIAFVNLCAGAVNYAINARMVTAPFNTPLFNDQVANVNAITRVVLVIPDMLALFFAFSLMYKAVYALLPQGLTGVDGKEPDFWELVREREARRRVRSTVEVTPEGAPAVGMEDAAAKARRQAREEFGIGR